MTAYKVTVENFETDLEGSIDRVETTALINGEKSAANPSGPPEPARAMTRDGAGKEIFTGQALAAGVNNLNFDVPDGASAGDSRVRFRCTTDGAMEDYSHTILDDGDGGRPTGRSPAPSSPTRITTETATPCQKLGKPVQRAISIKI